MIARLSTCLLVCLAVACGRKYDPENPTVEDIPVLLEAAKKALLAQGDPRSGGGIEAERCYRALQKAVQKIGEPAIPPLIAILTDEGRDAMSRDLAADCLGELGPAAKEAVPALVVAATQKKEPLSTSAAYAVWKIAPDTAAKSRLKRPPKAGDGQKPVGVRQKQP